MLEKINNFFEVTGPNFLQFHRAWPGYAAKQNEEVRKYVYISKRKLGQVTEFQAVSNTITHDLDNAMTLLKFHIQYKSQFDRILGWIIRENGLNSNEIHTGNNFS